MHKVLMVIRREYLDRVRKKSFWLGIALFPLIMVAMVVLPMLLVGLRPDEERKIAFVDGTGRLAEPLRRELAEDKLKDGRSRFTIENVPIKDSLDETRKTLEPRVSSGELYGILVAGDDPYAEDNFRFYAKNAGNIEVTQALERGLRKGVMAMRIESMKLSIPPEDIDRLAKRVELESYQVSATGEAQKRGFFEAYFGTFFFVIILFMSMLLYGVAVMRGILEEKSNRIMEVLLGSLSPEQLMTGKILGIGLVGLTQMVVYVITAAIVQIYVASSSRMPELVTSMVSMFRPSVLVFFIIFYLLGYFMYTALFAAVGAVCNTEQEAQNIQAPITWVLMIPMMATIYFVNNPDSTPAVVLSLIPIFTPMIMFMRITLSSPPLWQIALSIVLTLGTIVLIFKGVSRIFRIGILMYGKRPTIPEMMRWARS